VGLENNINGGKIDVVVKDNDGYIFYEIKTGNNSASCIRQALGQLFEYEFYPGKQNTKKIVVVGEPMIDGETNSYLNYLKNTFRCFGVNLGLLGVMPDIAGHRRLTPPVAGVRYWLIPKTSVPAVSRQRRGASGNTANYLHRWNTIIPVMLQVQPSKIKLPPSNIAHDPCTNSRKPSLINIYRDYTLMYT
jgi:hypothetical protein